MFGWHRELFTKIALFPDWSIRKKLLVTLIPLVMFILVVTGYATHRYSSGYLNQALGRTTLLYTMAQAHNIEVFLRQAADNLLLLSKNVDGKEDLRLFMESHRALHGAVYREVALVAAPGKEQAFFLNTGSEVVEVPVALGGQVKAGPLDSPRKGGEVRIGQVTFGGVVESVYPLGFLNSTASGMTLPVFRLTTPCVDRSGDIQGYLVLSLDAREVRNILSLFNSPKSPLYAFPRTSEKRYSFFFDAHGWIVFQSENPEDADKGLSTETARAGMSGTHGKLGNDGAFRPMPGHEIYWKMVVDAQAGNSGLEAVTAQYDASGSPPEYYMGYSPVRFVGEPGADPEVVGAVAYMDRSRLTAAAEFRQMDVMFSITLGAIVIVSGVIFVLGRVITRPILNLAAEVQTIMREDVPHEIALPESDYETTLLKRSINSMIDSLLRKDQQLLVKKEHLLQARLREKVDLESLCPQPTVLSAAGPMRDIVGASPAVAALKSNILKAATSTADVLIVGETGTGKELTAEAIHRLSVRSGRPFISINCGALDEYLLLDALFGHVKGAFSEAKTERKGAFLAANGGTLLLDEVGNASMKVQLALLRALSVRRIKPLGTDTEVDVDVRVLAATNVNLKEMAARGEFREDLYYRLKVISIETPPLRERKEDIVILADYFLRQAAKLGAGGEVSLSRGALTRLNAYDWPGNVRELKHCLTRAVAMAGRDVIYAEDLLFEDGSPVQTDPQVLGAGGPVSDYPSMGNSPESGPPSTLIPPPPGVYGLNPRQEKAVELLRVHGSITRRMYQDAVGENVPPRTAQHDLKDLVVRGVMRKVGNGPATRYSLA